MKNSEQEKRKLIDVKGIEKSFQTGDRFTHVLKNINFEVYENEFLVIFGPSGCGKSTVLHILMGLEKPDAGVVRFGGIDMWKMNSDDRADVRKRDMGIIYQKQNWVKSLTVVENVAISAQLLGLSKEEAIYKAEEMLKRVGILDKSDYMPSELSAGEQQKMGLARSLITDPKVIIADEPTGNLDVKSGKEMIDLLKDLTQNGITVIMVTHNPEYLREADRTIFMLDGELYKEIITKQSDMDSVLKAIQTDLDDFIQKNGKNKQLENNRSFPATKFVENDVPRKTFFQSIGYFLKFIFYFLINTLILLIGFLIGKISVDEMKKFNAKMTRVVSSIDKDTHISESINALDLTEISFQNLSTNKSRTSTTILGVSIGIGIIVFLLSIGYGLENLVINEVTRIQNQNAVEVSPIVGSNVELNDELLDSINQISGIKESFPLINSAAKSSFNGANTDLVVYGVPVGYLEQSQNTWLTGDSLDDSYNEIVINKEYLSILGGSANDILGKTVDLLMINQNLEGKEDSTDTSNTYKIVGVIDDGNPSVVYMNINEMKNYVPEGYSQLTIIISDKTEISNIRKQIEVLGFQTSSVMDTVSQVQSLFKNVRLGLVSLGLIAFTIAIIGMVNTLTVSLLERTREIGLLKTIGMKSDEIRTLFINESMFMGLAGGIGGVILGLVLGTIVSIVISIFSFTKDGSFIMINVLPWYMFIILPFASSIVGYLTGLYPSNRAVKIPPLDAIRYE
jgi:ABC-type lipoprotein export system ATPase subunit/ABC-type lipoprotein release transport system permease subunit